MLQQLILCFIGFCAGIIVAGGVSGLLIGLSIVPRYAGITHTADQIFLYESEFRWDLFSWLSAEYFSEFSWAAGSLHWQRSQKSFPSLPDG